MLQTQCIISLDSGSRFPGSWHRTKDLAMESAASCALKELQPGYQYKQTNQQQPLFNMSPNSAFTPIQPLTGNCLLMPLLDSISVAMYSAIKLV